MFATMTGRIERCLFVLCLSLAGCSGPAASVRVGAGEGVRAEDGVSPAELGLPADARCYEHPAGRPGIPPLPISGTLVYSAREAKWYVCHLRGSDSRRQAPSEEETPEPLTGGGSHQKLESG